MKSPGFMIAMQSIPVLVISLSMSIFGYCPEAYAQTNSQGVLHELLTLSSAIQMALEENPAIKAADFQVDASAAQVTQARSGFFPQVFISETFNQTNNPMWAFGTRLNQEIITQADFNPDKLNNPDAINNFTTALSMDWALFNPTQTWFPWQQSKQNLKASQYLLERARQEVIARTVNAYTGVLLAREQVNVVQQSLKTAQAHLKIIRDRYKNGFIVESDLLRMQVRVGELDQALIESESNLKVALANLNAVLGLPADHRVDLAGSLEEGPEIQGSVEKWVETALSRRPDLLVLQYQQQMAEKEIKKSESAHLPSIHIIGSYEWNSKDFSDMAENYTVGAVARLNLYSGNRMLAGTREAKAQLSRVQSMRKAMEDGIGVETRQAFFQIQSAWKRIAVAKTATRQSEAGLRIVKNRYESGLVAIVDLLDAQVTQQQSHMNYISALHQYKTAKANLALASGTIDADFQ